MNEEILRTKKCPRCGEVKSLDQFYRNSYSSSGLQSWCKACADNQKAQYCKNNHERVVAVRHLRYLKYKDKAYIYNHDRSLQRKALLVSHYSEQTNRCACCGESDLHFLTIDHTDGNGNQHRKNIGCRAGENFYRWLLKAGMPEGFQVLCYNCNLAKGHYGICPHKMDTKDANSRSKIKSRDIT